PEQRGRVDAHDLLEHRIAIGRDGGKGAAGSGVEKKGVNRPALRRQGIERADQLRLVAHIGRCPARVQIRAQFAQDPLAPGDQAQFAAADSDPFGGGPADPGAGPGDHDMAACEIHGPRPFYGLFEHIGDRIMQPIALNAIAEGACMSNGELSTLFFLAMTSILAASRITGWATQRFLGQPQVVGEMIAGVLLGPSLLGVVAPGVETMLFPPELKKLLYVGAQLGVGLYMFLVGLTFSRDEFRLNAGRAAAVSMAGMAAPFAAGAAMIPWLMRQPGLFTPQVSPAQASLFLGAAIAITAFP
ncbi:hypothetical protein E4T56_gene10034, partial [Termitomyces sp. T112]